MDSALVSALAAVLGSLVGGSATVAAAWVTQTTLTRRELLQADIRERERLYREFIGECSRLLIDAMTHPLDGPEKLSNAYELLNSIRLSASDAVLAEAERIIRRITEQYFQRNLSVEEVRALAMSDSGDPLRAFGEACRVELRSIRSGI
jgi:hypothetical protein